MPQQLRLPRPVVSGAVQAPQELPAPQVAVEAARAEGEADGVLLGHGVRAQRGVPHEGGMKFSSSRT